MSWSLPVPAEQQSESRPPAWPYPAGGTVVFSILVPIALAALVYVPQAFDEAPESMVRAAGKVALCMAAPLGNCYLIRSVSRSMNGSKACSMIHGVVVGAASITASPFVLVLPQIMLLLLFGVGVLGLLPIASAISSYRIGGYFSPRLGGRAFLCGLGVVLAILYLISSGQIADRIAVSRAARGGFAGMAREELRGINPKLLKLTACADLPRLEEAAYWPLQWVFPVTYADLAAGYFAVTGHRLDCSGA